MAWCMHVMWVTHGMHVCMPCGFVRSIKMGSVEEKRGKNKKNEKKMREKEGRKEDLTASFSEFRHSNGWSSSGQELKLATLQEVGIFSYSG